MKTQSFVVIALSALIAAGCGSKSSTNESPTNASPPPPQQVKEENQFEPRMPTEPISAALDPIPTNIPFQTQLELHAKRLQDLWAIREDAIARKAKANATRQTVGISDAQKSVAFDDFATADQDESNASVALAPYALAQQQAQELVDQGYTPRQQTEPGTPGEDDDMCKEDGGKKECVDVSGIVYVLYLIVSPIIKSVDDLIHNGKLGDSNELVKLWNWTQRPLGGPNNTLRQIREAILMGDNGEISRLIRDPGKRPVEIVKKWRDKVLPKDSNNDVVRTLRNPVKCAATLWKDC